MKNFSLPLLLLVCCIRFSSSYLVDDQRWRRLYMIAPRLFMSEGNHTSWKARACCGDNDTVRPANQTRLLNYLNDTWCKGNQTCLDFAPKGDLKWAYNTYRTENYSATSAWFWAWTLKTSIGDTNQKYIVCRMDYWPRWDWLYLCQNYMPSATNVWIYGSRWYCGSDSMYSVCTGKGYKVPFMASLINMTALDNSVMNMYVQCCYPLPNF